MLAHFFIVAKTVMKNLLLIFSIVLILTGFGCSLFFGDNKPALLVCAIGALAGMYGFQAIAEKE